MLKETHQARHLRAPQALPALPSGGRPSRRSSRPPAAPAGLSSWAGSSNSSQEFDSEIGFVQKFLVPSKFIVDHLHFPKSSMAMKTLQIYHCFFVQTKIT